jgi:hypothetical protein
VPSLQKQRQHLPDQAPYLLDQVPYLPRARQYRLEWVVCQ